MAPALVSPSTLCRPEEDPFLLLESTFHAVQDILARCQVRVGAPWLSQATAQVGVRPPGGLRPPLIWGIRSTRR
jgi:hypothetical protein